MCSHSMREMFLSGSPVMLVKCSVVFSLFVDRRLEIGDMFDIHVGVHLSVMIALNYLASGAGED